MEDRVFLGKYRVATAKSAQWWEAHRRHFGVTCPALEIESGRKVMLELVPAFLLGATYRKALSETAARARLIRHQNIPTLYEFGEEGERFVYVVEHVNGLTAKEWIEAQGPAPIATALGIALQVVSALALAAQHKIHYPAIHPDNLVLVPGHRADDKWPLVKVLHFLGPPPTLRDFDVSDPMRADAAAPYASPEQKAGASVDFPSATYSLGATIWFLLSGTEPAGATGRADKKRAIHPEPASLRFAGLPEDVRSLLARMSSENRDARPSDPLALEEEIRACLSQLDPAAMRQALVPVLPEIPETPMVPPVRRLFGMKWLAGVGAVALLVLAWRATSEIASPQSPGEVVKLPDHQASRVALIAARPKPAKKNGGLPGAMNFSVVPPSYENESGQVRSLEQFPGAAFAQGTSFLTEATPPGEGPDDGSVAGLSTKSGRGLSAKALNLVTPVMSATRVGPSASGPGRPKRD